MPHTKAITRLPGANFADGITTSNLGPPDYRLAQQQHAQYCDVLRHLGVAVEVLPADPLYPDGCFVEDTAIVTKRGSILTNPGDPTRSGETATIERAIATKKLSPIVAQIVAPGTLDGGDVLRIDDEFVIGLSNRTNTAGADQLGAALMQLGYETRVINIPAELLHLKTGVSHIGKNTLIAIPSLAQHEAFTEFNAIIPADPEHYAANTLLVNDTVILPAGFPGVHRAIQELGLPIIETPMTEFQKMDGGLTCLSLLF